MAHLLAYIDSFTFNESLPLYRGEVAVAVGAAYLAGVFGLRVLWAGRKPLRFPWFALVHNVFLSAFSLLDLVFIAWELLGIFLSGGAEALFCDRANKFQTGRLYFYFYLFYLSKVYEFIDTILIVFKHGQLTFLHVYHHFITLILVWVNLYYGIPIQWICISTNLAVHVLMYYYYALRTVGKDVVWKKWVTTSQIIQFRVDLVLCTSAYLYHWYSGWQCTGGNWGWLFGLGVLASFLALFINFSRQTYKTKEQ